MRLVILAASAALLAAPAAQAQMYPAPIQRPLQAVPAPLYAFETPNGERRIAGWHSFHCWPTPDMKDRNPPIAAFVGLGLSPDNRVQDMLVSYELASGEQVARGDQYGAIAGNDGVIYGWTGTYRRNANKRMAGGLFFGSDNQWHYREKQWEYGRVQYDYIMPCEVIDTGD
jgi:hypothetical protein